MVWKETKDSEGRVYYYNDSGATTWEKPEELLSPFEKKLLIHGWKTASTAEGQIYYYKTSTGETRWDPPFPSDESGAEPSIASSQTESKIEELQDSSRPKGNSLATDRKDKSKNLDLKSVLQDSQARFRNESKLLAVSKVSSKEEAEKVFMDMFAEYKVDATWSFNRIITEIGPVDSRYWVIDDDPVWKQMMFDKYLSNRTESQLIEEHQQLEKFESAFFEFLSNRSDIQYYSRWATIKRKIAEEPIYKHSVVSEKLKRKVFLKYIKNLCAKREEQDAKVRDEALKELNLYFTSIEEDMDPLKLPWPKFASKYLWGTPRFEANKNFKILTKSDVLQGYIKRVELIIPVLKDQINESNKVIYRKDRISRDNFKALLDEIAQKITHESTWKDVYPLFKNDERFTAMLGRGGSSALELFLDRLEELKVTYNAKCSIASQILGSQQLDPEKMPLKDSVEILRKHSQFQNLSEQYLDDIVKGVVSLLSKQRNEDKKRELSNAANSIQGKEFESILQVTYSTEKPTSWSSVRDKFDSTIKKLGLAEEVAELVYEKYEPKGRSTKKRPLEYKKDAPELDY